MTSKADDNNRKMVPLGLLNHVDNIHKPIGYVYSLQQ